MFYRLSIVLDKLKTLTATRPRKIFTFLLIIIFTSLSLAYLSQDKNTQRDDHLLTNTEQGFEKLIIPEREATFFEVNTKEFKRFGILPREELILTTKQNVPEEFIIQNLESTPSVNIEKVGDNEYKLVPNSNLGIDQPINITLNTKNKSIGGTNFEKKLQLEFSSTRKV